MFLHIGKNHSIPTKDIVTIIDKKTSLYSQDTIDFLKAIEKEGNLFNSDDNTRTYIVTRRKERNNKTGEYISKDIVYTSSISSNTLFKRNV